MEKGELLKLLERKIPLDELIRTVQKEDLDVRVSGGFILSANFGTLTHLRVVLEKVFGRGFIFGQIAGQPLYLVHWNDLSEKKQQEILDGKKRRMERSTS